MILRYAIALTLSFALGLAPPAAAQQRVVVPEGAAVAVPARGMPVAPRAARPPPRTARSLTPVAEPQLPAAAALAPLPAAAALVPLAAAAALAAALAGGGGGSGGGVSAPVRTR
jgi:hypothetical protein